MYSQLHRFFLTFIQIPGFYYDPEKKRYFKIQPNQFSSLGHTITKQNIEQKALETKRIQNLTKQTDKVHSHHFLELMSKQAVGSVTSLQFQRYFIHKRISCIENHPSQTLSVSSIHGTLEHPKVIGLNSSHDKLISMWSLSSSLAKCINMVDIDVSNTGDIAIDFDKPSLNLCNSASSMYWTERKKSLPLHLLYTTGPYFGNESCTAHICQVSNEGLCGTTNSYSIGQQYVWCCALDPDYKKFSIGCEKGALLIEVETRRLWEISTHRGDVSSIAFTHKVKYCTLNLNMIRTCMCQSSTCCIPFILSYKILQFNDLFNLFIYILIDSVHLNLKNSPITCIKKIINCNMKKSQIDFLFV